VKEAVTKRGKEVVVVAVAATAPSVTAAVITMQGPLVVVVLIILALGPVEMATRKPQPLITLIQRTKGLLLRACIIMEKVSTRELFQEP